MFAFIISFSSSLCWALSRLLSGDLQLDQNESLVLTCAAALGLTTNDALVAHQAMPTLRPFLLRL